jgi:hypothetical protein
MMSVDATDVRWVDAHVPEMAATFLTTKIYRLRNVDGSRVLWQVCRFAYSGAGRYRCGIDVAIGSLAQIAQSDWVTVVSVDSEQVARRGFTV